MRRVRRGISVVAGMLLLCAVPVYGQESAAPVSSVALPEGRHVAPLTLALDAVPQARPVGSPAPDVTQLHNPWSQRPVCASMFLKADWRLSSKQKMCNWLQNGVFSTGRMATAAVSTMFSMMIDRESEHGDGFALRYGRKWTQGAVATTGEYLGALIAHEDPREIPPYLALQSEAPPHGFARRFGAAIRRTVIKTECVEPCSEEKHIHNRVALSHLLGAAGSGVAGVAMNWDEPDRGQRVLNGFLTAYSSAFAHQLLSEFKPEAAKLGGRVFRLLGGH